MKTKLPFIVDAVWTIPPDDWGYAERLRRIKSRFTKQLLQEGVNIAKDDGGEYKLWQKRYWEHTIRDDRDFEVHVNYVHINPVKHGYVARAIDWRHSTIHRYLKCGELPMDWACAPDNGDFGER